MIPPLLIEVNADHTSTSLLKFLFSGTPVSVKTPAVPGGTPVNLQKIDSAAIQRAAADLPSSVFNTLQQVAGHRTPFASAGYGQFQVTPIINYLPYKMTLLHLQKHIFWYAVSKLSLNGHFVLWYAVTFQNQLYVSATAVRYVGGLQRSHGNVVVTFGKLCSPADHQAQKLLLCMLSSISTHIWWQILHNWKRYFSSNKFLITVPQ
jgi:hypothetical protein